MSLKPWRKIAIPHEDVLRGTFQQAEFPADISRVHAGTATQEYQDAGFFFQRTRGFDGNIQHAVRENCNQLKFKNGTFED